MRGSVLSTVKSAWRLVGSGIAVAALLVQPLLALNVPAAFAVAGPDWSPDNLTLDGGETGTTSTSVDGYTSLSVSFHFDIGKLEAGDNLNYGWRDGVAGADHSLGTLAGESGNPGTNEVGDKTVSLPDGAGLSDTVLYFTNTGSSSGTNDRVTVSALTITGTAPASVVPTAAAASSQVVKPADLGYAGWYFYNDSTDVPNTTEVAGEYAITTDPTNASVGALKFDSSDKMDIATNLYAGTKLNDIAAIGYDSYNGAAGSAHTYIQFNVSFDGTSTWQNRLTYIPTSSVGAWQSNEGVQSGAGLWEWSKMTSGGASAWPDGVTDKYRTWNDILASFPDAKIQDGTAGQLVVRSEHDTQNYIDHVYLATASSNVHYDFEYATAAAPTAPASTGTVIFDALPSPFVSNLASLGYAATSTAALGDKVTFAGTDRHLVEVQVDLSSWACESGSWNAGNCATTPGEMFSHPITLNIYNVTTDGGVGSLIASKTQAFDIPYRPSANPACSDSKQWMDENGDCFSGINHVVTFDVSGVVVPDTVIYSVAYNTNNYGDSPIGVSGPYDSLNVGFNTIDASPTVGTDVNSDEVFWDTTYPHYTAGLKADSGWSGYMVAAKFTAITPDTTKPTAVLNVDEYNPTSYSVVAHDNAELSIVTGNLYSGTGTLLKSCSTHVSGVADYTLNCAVPATYTDGTYKIKYNAKDAAGNLSSTGTTYFTIDNTKPSASITYPGANDVLSGGTFTVNGTASDANGVDYVKYTVNEITGFGGSYVGSAASGIATGTTNWEFPVAGLSDGYYRVKVQVFDMAGNWRYAYHDVQVDGTKPVTIVATPDGQTYTGGNVEVDAETKDVGGSGIVKVVMNLYGTGGLLSTCVNKAINPAEEVVAYDCTIPVNSLENGDYYLKINSLDAAGHVSNTVTWNFTIDVDDSTPISTPTTPTNGDATNTGNTGGNNVTGNGETIPVVTQTAQTPFAAVPFATTGGQQGDNGEVLGAETTTPSDADAADDTNGSTLGAADEKNDGANDKGWNFLGLAWYWWLIILAVLGGIIWALFGRRNATE